MSSAEDELRKLAKLAENKRCANCEVEDKVFGYKNICMPYKSFVCGTCKAAHQGFSHRVKEINQSNFSAAEVESLRPRSGGSNDAVRRTWLARCALDDPARPRPGDPLEKYKAFVVAAYEQRRWYSEPSAAPVAPPAPAPSIAAAPPALALGANVKKGPWGQQGAAKPTPVAAAPVFAAATSPPPTEEFDLLGISTPMSMSSPQALSPLPAPASSAASFEFSRGGSSGGATNGFSAVTPHFGGTPRAEAPAPAPAASSFDFAFNAPPAPVAARSAAVPTGFASSFDFGVSPPAPAAVSSAAFGGLDSLVFSPVGSAAQTAAPQMSAFAFSLSASPPASFAPPAPTFDLFSAPTAQSPRMSAPLVAAPPGYGSGASAMSPTVMSTSQTGSAISDAFAAAPLPPSQALAYQQYAASAAAMAYQTQARHAQMAAAQAQAQQAQQLQAQLAAQRSAAYSAAGAPPSGFTVAPRPNAGFDPFFGL